MNRKRRIYVGLLTSGLMCLGIDKFMLGAAPSSASAASAVQSHIARALPVDGTVAELRALAAGLDDSYAANLADLLESHAGGRNAFNPGSAWTLTSGPADLSPDTTAPPSASIRVSSVVLGRVPMALINGRTVRPGDEVEPGLVVESIDDAGVTLRRGDDRLRIAVGD